MNPTATNFHQHPQLELFRGGQLLASITYLECDQPWFHGTFTTGPALDRVRPPFPG